VRFDQTNILDAKHRKPESTGRGRQLSGPVFVNLRTNLPFYHFVIKSKVVEYLNSYQTVYNYFKLDAFLKTFLVETS